MFGDLNKVELIGNITSDLQVRYTPTGNAVLSFGVATNRRYKQGDAGEWKDEATFHNVVVWGNQAEQLAQRARKGTRLFISGRLQTRSWDDADGKKNYKTEIISENLILLDRYEKGSSADMPSPTAAPAKGKSKKETDKSETNENTVIDPDDLPF